MDKQAKSQTAQREEATLAWWQQNQIFERTIEQRQGAKPFIFYEGPPTANAKAALHHMLARAYKDVVVRYKTMRGFEVKRRAGWDTHGLPVEVQVEKALGLANKKEIENIVPGNRSASIAKFNQVCRENVWSHIKDWEYFTERMGYWLDFSNAYITYEREYIESLWRIIKKVYEDGRLVKSHKVVPYCPRCGTPLSSHEVAQEYQDVVDKTVYVKFPVTGEPNTYFLAWTTTPWTLPGNIALAVGAEIDYVLANQAGEQYYLARDRADKVLSSGYEIVRSVKADELVGKQYEPIFAVAKLAEQDKVYQVIAAPFVTTNEGTGIVHTAAMYGVEDYEEAVKQNLPRIHTVDEAGHFTADVTDFAGQHVFEATTGIIAALKETDRLFKQQDHKHSYPFCWRCKSKLIYYAKDSWFITMSGLKEQLIAINNQVNWVPDYIKTGRYGEWLQELRDWSFSRDRFWGTPLPVWTNKETGKHLVIDSVDELRAKAVDPTLVPADFDPHRPFVDAVVVQDDEGREYHFEEVICDVWFDSGAMPFASGEDAAGRYPADYISEAIDQTRGWFYTLQAVAVLMDKQEPPYRNVICLGHINDEHGKKMSKSLGNIVDPIELADKYGMDAVRFYLYTINQPGNTKRFVEKDLLTSYRKNQQILENVVSFYHTYAATASAGAPELLDRWAESRYHQLVTVVTQSMDDYDITGAARAISDFIADLSQWYVRRSRDRKTTAFFATLKMILNGLARLMAPFTPFYAETVWSEVRTESEPESVHLADWSQSEKYDEAVLRQMTLIREIVEGGHTLRQQAKLKVRQPLARLTIKGEALAEDDLLIIAAELNIEQMVVADTLPAGQPVFAVNQAVEIALDTALTDSLRQKGVERELIRAWQDARRQFGLTPGQEATLLMVLPAGFTPELLAGLAKRVNLIWQEATATGTYEVKLADQDITFDLR
ncbi:MAG: isoleucine--tRNA ligase [bacterium]|nr:isoleucine--tRNA ligase [bacterium]